ncbi:MAG: hypothetical protein LUG95_02340 [Clostridiales bacterium]|nr:hypothetical protein [Clostridiales bacterium]
MHFGGIWGVSSAISKVGLEHRLLFCLWGITTFFALAYNICIAYSDTKYKFYIPLLALAGIGMIVTLSCDFDYSLYPQYIAHCIGLLGFSVVMGVTVFLFFLFTKQYVICGLCAIVLLADLLLLIIFKQNFFDRDNTDYSRIYSSFNK